ncbi:MAG: polymer-forming cytoskeletal protein [Bacteroidota bacterium]
MAKQVNSEGQNQSINIINEATKIKGDIISDGDIRIDGQLVGNLVSKGRVVVGSSGKIEGQIQSGNVEISGYVKGKIIANDLMNMKVSAKIEGDVIAGKLSVEPGATFTGTCSMGGTNKVNEPEPGREKEKEKEKK